jgi:serine/threonine protein kinase, bacterial
MRFVYCQQGHENPSEHRFCSVCGELLVTQSVAQPEPQPEPLLDNRYQIVRMLGWGGFGRTYLAQDRHRFNEACVLKEFAPQVQGQSALQKAEELFAREAGVLYGLKHPQIPQFRELFRATLEGQERLFLVQDYVEGQTYRQLLDARRPHGLFFSEIEMRQLFAQLLPVLHYIHRVGVIHRDISPDNLILRSRDQLPVLIDFGGVKQIAAVATSKYTTANPITRLGKVGYAPAEQMQEGLVSPESDLYALAVTALVLMTGQEPLTLLEWQDSTPHWQLVTQLSPTFANVLARMLASYPDARFASAEAVLQALDLPLPPLPPDLSIAASTAMPPITIPPTLPPATPDPVTLSPTTVPTLNPAASVMSQPADRPRPWLGWLMVPVALVALTAAWSWRDRWWPVLNPTAPPTESGQPEQSDAPDSLSGRAEAVGIDPNFLIKLTDATFRERYPDQADRTLSNSAEDAEWRQVWSDLAEEWLAKIPQLLSPAARQKLGSYTADDRNQWKQTINQLYVGSRSLFDLTDAAFFHQFAEQRDKDFLNQPIGQIWHGIAVDQITALQSGQTLERIEFEPGAFSAQREATLAAGTGRVYVANLAEGQIMRLNLQAPADSTQLSVYLPRPTKELPVLLEDSDQLTWTGDLPQSGYYEMVVVNRVNQPIQFQLNLAVDNVTSSPVTPQQGEAPEAKD